MPDNLDVGLRGLVLLDVIEIITEAFPGFNAIAAQSTLEATQLATNLKSVRFGFINVDPDEFVRTELASLLSSLGTRIVLWGMPQKTKRRSRRLTC